MTLIPTPDLEIEMLAETNDRIEELSKSKDPKNEERILGEAMFFLEDKMEIIREQIKETIKF